MTLPDWPLQSDPEPRDVLSAESGAQSTNGEQIMMHTDIDGPGAEPAVSLSAPKVEIAVELPKISLERRKEFVLVDDLDDDDDDGGGIEASLFDAFGDAGGLRKRKRDHDAEYNDGLEEDDYLSSESQDQAMSSGDRPVGRLSGRTSGRNTRQTSRIASTDNDEDDEIILDRPKRTRNLRPRYESTRMTANSSRFGRSDDVDELAQEPEEIGSDGDFVLIQSDLQPRRLTKRRKRSSRMISLRGKGTKDGIEFEAPRRSGRANKATGNMFEQMDVDDDNFSIDDDRSPGVPKVIAVKEIFQPLTAEEAGFRDVHCPSCSTCDANNPNKGALIYCQGCSFSYHKVCLGQRAARDHLVTKIAQDSFVLQCRYCINLYQKKDQRAPDLTRCFTCRESGKSCTPFSQRKTAKQEEQLRLENNGEDPVHEVDRQLINNADTCIFRCTTCRRGFHFEHLPSASSENTSHITSDTDTLRAKNIEEYSIEWKCKDCTDAPGKIDALIAWRPVDHENYVGQSYLDYGEDHIEYLVKWEKQSHRHCVWMPGSWVWGAAHGSMRSAYAKRVAAEGIGPQFDIKNAIPEELTMIDVILSVQYKGSFHATSKEADFQNVRKIDKVYVKFLGLGYDEAVWDDPPPTNSGKLYDEFLSAYDEYLAGVYFEDVSRSEMLDRIKEFRALDFAGQIESTEQPHTIQNGELMKYQVSGVNWLKYNYHKQHNAILADEMGLGKTVQIVALLADLVKDAPRVWPFLIVVPNSTVPNWRREIKKWAPDLRVVTYHGGKQAQDLAFRFELFPRGSTTMKAHIVVMSYEAAQDPGTKTRFNSTQFAGLIVDEGHRLKNDQNLLYAALMAMKIPYRVLLTGTPLQNNKRELFNLLQFLNPKLDAAKLDEEYGELTAENIPKLHDTIRPYFLRRTKADTLKFLPKMARVIIPVTMTVLQEKLSKSIIAKNSQLIHAILAKGKLKATERGSLNNILMQLRKCLCHPFIYSSAVEDRVEDPVKMHNNLVEASAKLLLLNLMLPKLKEQGHRVLLFSQFLDQLDIMEDFLSGLGLTYSRIDGNMSSLEKQKRIDAYNAPDSPIFVMLLSTRAGGVGINLATADTVMILDPDFNPHQDLQAVSRCHRIGQRKPVLCFQFTTKDSVEEKILQAGRKKMALDHALIESMDDQKEEVHDLESILKHGAEALFSDAKRDTITYDSAAVDKLLDRERLIAEQNPPEGEEGQTLNDAFSFARVWDNAAGDIVTESLESEVDPVINQSVWEDILRKREEEARLEAEANKEILGRGARRRGKAIQYSTNRDGAEDGQEDGAPGDDDLSGYDDDFVGSGAESEAESADEVPGIVTPPGELAEADTRGKKTKGKASQGTTPAKQFSKLLKQNHVPKKTAAPKTPTPKKSLATPTPKKSRALKQPSTSKYADIKRAVKPKKVDEDKTVCKIMTKATSIDTTKPQTPSHPMPTEQTAINPSASIDAPTAHAPKDATLPRAIPHRGKYRQHQATQARPAGLPSPPHYLPDLSQVPKFKNPGMASPPTHPPSINPALICPKKATTSLPPAPASLPPRPPSALRPHQSKSISQPADLTMGNTMFNGMGPYRLINEPSYLPYSMEHYLPSNEPSCLPSSMRNFPTNHGSNFLPYPMEQYRPSNDPSYLPSSMRDFPTNHGSNFLPYPMGHYRPSNEPSSLPNGMRNFPTTNGSSFLPQPMGPYLPSNEHLPNSNSTGTAAVCPPQMHQVGPSQVAPQPSDFLWATPGMGTALTLPMMGNSPDMEAYLGNPVSTVDQPSHRSWDKSTWDLPSEAWDPPSDQ